MEHNELLQAISDMIDKKIAPINIRLDKIEVRLDTVETRLDAIDNRFGRLERQLKHIEHSLKSDIIESENLILEEVSRVHRFLNEHIQNQQIHTA